MVLMVVSALIAAPVVTLTSVTSCGIVGCFTTVTSPLFAMIVVAISSATRVAQIPTIGFVIVATWARFPYVVLTISPAACGFHQVGDGL
jgi:hypothetical protein